MGILLGPVNRKSGSSSNIHIFKSKKIHEVFVSSWIKRMRSKILINELAHIKFIENTNTAMF